jgi:hypothetical protein
MITEFFIWVMAGVGRLMMAIIPDGDSGSGAADGFQQGIGTVLAYATGFGNWIPWSVVGPVVLLVLASLIASGGIKLIRIFLSFITLGGGGA